MGLCRVRRSRWRVLFLGFAFGILFFCFHFENWSHGASRALHGNSHEYQQKHGSRNDLNATQQDRYATHLFHFSMKEEGNQVSGRPNSFPYSRTAAKCIYRVYYTLFNSRKLCSHKTGHICYEIQTFTVVGSRLILQNQFVPTLRGHTL